MWEEAAGRRYLLHPRMGGLWESCSHGVALSLGYCRCGVGMLPPPAFMLTLASRPCLLPLLASSFPAVSGFCVHCPLRPAFCSLPLCSCAAGSSQFHLCASPALKVPQFFSSLFERFVLYIQVSFIFSSSLPAICLCLACLALLHPLIPTVLLPGSPLSLLPPGTHL